MDSDTPLKRKRSAENESANVFASSNKTPRASQTAGVPSSSSENGPIAQPTRAPPHLEINYLARRYAEDIPLISTDDSLLAALGLLAAYHEALDRSESLASNLGARPLGTVLIQRFEKLFDHPEPKVVQQLQPGRRAHVTWFDVVEFATTKPDQFHVVQLEDGSRVCQMDIKNCRVQVSEEESILISSGGPQKLIPPQPIAEDEEKELGALEILESTVAQISHLADQVAAISRQFNHRLKGRKQAIVDRRASETAVSGAAVLRAASPSNVALPNGSSDDHLTQGDGFQETPQDPIDPAMAPPANPAAVSPAVHDELIKIFTSRRTFQAPTTPAHASRRRSQGSSRQVGRSSSANMFADASHHANPANPFPTTGPNAFPPPPSTPRATGDDGGPYKAVMTARIETLPKGVRIIPPCDRCRRLKIDCLKNLSACVGCTKKHAKCSWRDLREDELEALDLHLLPQQHVYQHPDMHDQGPPPPPDHQLESQQPYQDSPDAAAMDAGDPLDPHGYIPATQSKSTTRRRKPQMHHADQRQHDEHYTGTESHAQNAEESDYQRQKEAGLAIAAMGDAAMRAGSGGSAPMASMQAGNGAHASTGAEYAS